jgi:hypothetical protein
MKATITNNSRALQGVHSVTGLVNIEPGKSRVVDVAEGYAERVDALPFLSVEWADEPKQDKPQDKPVVQAKPKATAAKKGKAPPDPAREDLKKQAAELGITFNRNIATDKLRDLVDAKLAS